ncbi:DUF488 domain-containing protein [Bdellovibrio bacteriovorus]|uniref:DUF488 domain-containing protein n=1 Tax=Bdellovibrio bacteriovorus TaxID=959 RepID=UPI0035A5B275
MIKIKRVYEKPSKEDGYRVLVDRLWPRGIKKEDLKFSEWPKEICPSTELRKEFGHKPEKFGEFRTEYKKELKSAEAHDKLAELAERAQDGNVTLLYAARDEKTNHAIVLKEVLDKL